MDFLIADTFTGSLAKLTGEEQKAVKTTAFDLQVHPENPGHQFHRVDRSKDPNFWSVRAGRDLRLIVHRTPESLLLCYVNHHDAAYQWAGRRRLETHPRTGAAQLVEVRERVEEEAAPRQPAPAAAQERVFNYISDGELLAYGVPAEWMPDARLATEDTLLDLVAHLPAEAAEALLNLAIGIKPVKPEPAAAGANPFAHPDALRRFRVMRNVEELALALDYPWEKWAVFLHPEQRKLVSKDFAGAAKVAGSAGTGKTVVALHRAVHLARQNTGARVLLTTFSEPLARALDNRLRLLLKNEPRLAERVEVYAMDAIAQRLFEINLGPKAGPVKLASERDVDDLIREAALAVGGHTFTQKFLRSEWEQVVDAWQLDTWEGYRDVARLGRRTRLKEAQRAILWSIFEKVRTGLHARGLMTQSGLFNVLAAHYSGTASSPFDYVVVDEAQDVSIAQLRFLGSIAGSRPNGLFFAGDLGQRIFQQSFSWKAAGVDIRGRSTTLKINYRTSHQIRAQSDRLLSAKVTDVDGNVEDRSGTVSVFDGPKPVLHVAASSEAEGEYVGRWLRQITTGDVRPEQIAIFVRSEAEVERATAAVRNAGLVSTLLDEQVAVKPGQLSIGTMHLAKGLEFRAVVVMACDDGILPLEARMEAVADESDLEEVYGSERSLLYVACTRARDHLIVTAAAPASEFLDDMASLS